MRSETPPVLIAQAATPDRNDVGISTPRIIADAGNAAKFAYEEFLLGRIRNPNTRRAYERASRRFFDWCEQRQRTLPSVTPADLGTYLDGLDLSDTSKKLHLAALRHLFDELVTRHVAILNPATSVRGPRLSVVEGRTPEITTAQARELLTSIPTHHPLWPPRPGSHRDADLHGRRHRRGREAAASGLLSRRRTASAPLRR